MKLGLTALALWATLLAYTCVPVYTQGHSHLHINTPTRKVTNRAGRAVEANKNKV